MDDDSIDYTKHNWTHERFYFATFDDCEECMQLYPTNNNPQLTEGIKHG